MTAPPAFPTLQLTIDPEIAPKIKVSSFLLEPVRAGDRPSSLDRALEDLTTKYCAIWSQPADAHEALMPARRLYHALGIDPSKTRPSSEALLRRVLKGKGLYRVNAVVDAGNLASLTMLLSVGLYDADKVHPPLTLRIGKDGEEFEGIRKDAVHLHGRPTLVDAEGPFGNPTSDSLRTCITEATRRVWFVVFAPSDYPDATLEDDLARAHAILEEYAGGETA